MKLNSWGPRNILVTAAAGVALTIVISWLTWRRADRPASEFPAWLEAFATVFGVGAAIVAGFYAARAFALEFQRDSRWEESNRSAQASRVAAWPLKPIFEFTTQIDSDGFQVQTPVAVQGYLVRLRNASDLPIAGVRIVASVMMVRPDVFADEIDIGVGESAHLDPETTVDVVVPAARPKSLVPLVSESNREIRVFLQFKDAVGRSWTRRTHEGELRDAGTRAERTVYVRRERWWDRLVRRKR